MRELADRAREFGEKVVAVETVLYLHGLFYRIQGVL